MHLNNYKDKFLSSVVRQEHHHTTWINFFLVVFKHTTGQNPSISLSIKRRAQLLYNLRQVFRWSADGTVSSGEHRFQWEEVSTECQATYPRLVFTLTHNLKAHKSLSPSWSPDMLSRYLIQAFCSDTTSECSDPISLRVGSIQGEIAEVEEATQITLLSIAISDKTSHQHSKPTIGNPPGHVHQHS